MDKLIKRIAHYYRGRFVFVLFLVIVLLASLAWHNRFIWDDPFIKNKQNTPLFYSGDECY
jgi:hypothetical protein